MANKKVTNDLGYLGEDAQYQIIKALVEDDDFFRRMYSILNQNAFTNQTLRQIAGILKDTWKESGKHVTYKQLELLLVEKAKDEIDVETARATISHLQSEDMLDGLDLVKQISFRFFAQQETLKVLQKAIEGLSKDGFVEGKTITKTMEGLAAIGKSSLSDEEKNITPIDLFDEIMSKSEEERVKTGIAELDTAMNGGLPKKNVGLLIAKTGAGKTSLGTIFCAGAAKAGYKVVQIFFEESIEDIGAKHFAFHTGKYTKEFNNKADKVAIWNQIKQDQEVYDAMKRNLILKRMNNGSTTIEEIRDYLKHLIAIGFKPDMVFIDYFSCIQTSSDRRVMYGNEIKAGEMAMKKIEQMAYDLDMAIWVAEQTNRMALKKVSDFERMGNIQGNYRITQPASFILNLERAEDRADYNSANLYMDKCRGCEPRQWKGIILNNGNLQIDMSASYDEQEVPWDGEYKSIIMENGNLYRE